MSRTTSAIDRLYRISVSNEQSSLRLDKRKLIQAARTLLRAERVAQAEISIALLDDEAIHQVNLEYLNHDYPPDVLSFVLDEAGEGTPAKTGKSGSRERGAGKILSGEVLIGVDEAIRGAKKFDWPAEHEVLLYLVHGLLHICGYDDLSPSEKKIMRSREKDILALWDLVPPYLRRTSPVKKISPKKSSPQKTSSKKSHTVSSSRKGGRSR